MHYLKRNTKYSIFAFLIIVLSITISISTLANTEVYFSLYDNPQILSTTSSKPEVQIININSAFQGELTGILQISEPLAWKIIALIEELGEFEEPEDLLQFTEITDLEWEEWKEQGIIINVD